MRIGIATITSTALVAGTLVAVPAHPLLPVTAVAQAQDVIASQALTAEDIATARALGIDLALLNLPVLDAIEAEDAWPNSIDGEDDQLNLELLQALEVNLGGTLSNLPLIKGGSGQGLLDLGGQGVGLLGAAADAPGVEGITASAGTLAQNGSIGLDPNLGDSTEPAKIDVLALTDQLGVDPLVSALVQELNLELGAVGSQIEKNGDTYTSAYNVADLNLVLQSTAVADLAGALNGVGETLDTTLSGVLGDTGIVNGITAALGPLTGTLGLGTPQVTLDTNLQATVQDLIGGVIYDGQSTGGLVEDALVELNLTDGTIKVNLENLHAEGLNDRPANTELTTAELTLITDTVNELVQELLDRVEAALQNGVADTEVTISIGVDSNDGNSSAIITLLEGLGTFDFAKIAQFITGLLGGLVGGIEINATVGGLLGTDGYAEPTIVSTGDGLLMELLAPLLDGILADVVPAVGGPLQTLLFSEVDRVLDATLAAGPANQVLDTLAPLLDTVLQEAVLITLNKQVDSTVAGQPSRAITALDVQLLPNLLAQSTSLALATSQVSGPSSANLENYAPTITVIPDEGLFGEPTTATIAGENLVYIGTDGVPVSLVTELTFGTETVPSGDITANADGSLTVAVPVATAGTGETERPVDVTLTTGGGQATDIYTYKAPVAPVVTLDEIADKTGVVGTPIADFGFTTSPTDATITVAGLPAGITFDATTGLVSGIPTAATTTPVEVTVTATSGTATPAVQTFTFSVSEAPVTTVTVGAIADQAITLGDAIEDVTPVVTPLGADVTVTGLPDGVSFDGTTISGTPTAEGTATVTVTASVGGVVSAPVTFDIVTSAVGAPVIEPIDDQTGTVGEEIDEIPVIVTPDGSQVDVEDLPDGIEYNPDTGIIAGVPEEGTEGSHTITVIATNDGESTTETFVLVISEAGTTPPPAVGGSENGSSEFLQQCLNSPAAGVAGLLVALGVIGAVAGPALEPMFKAVGGELDRQLRMLVGSTAGAHQPQWVRNINKGLNDAANAVDHQMVTNGLFATAAIALASSPLLCGMDNSSSGSSSSS